MRWSQKLRLVFDLAATTLLLACTLPLLAILFFIPRWIRARSEPPTQ